jgi:tetratricopeptide (TPR) repeat protein
VFCTCIGTAETQTKKPSDLSLRDQCARAFLFKQWDDLIALATRALSDKSLPRYEQVSYFWHRAEAYNGKKAWDKAIADSDQLITYTESFYQCLGYNLRAQAYRGKCDYRKAVADYKNAIRADPTDSRAFAELAWLYATCPDENDRDSELAIGYAREAHALARRAISGEPWAEVVAAAYAQSGDFKEAVAWQKTALKERLADRGQARHRLELYEHETPYRDDVGSGPMVP